MLTEPRNRAVLVEQSTTLNGIDFIELPAVDATTLYVHFLNTVAVETATITATISGGDRIRNINLAKIKSADFSLDPDGRPLLALHADRPGDFSTYTITIANAPLDVLYASTGFSFKALCPSDFDCVTSPVCCLPDDPPLPAIDYLAKDFQSFKLALSDFSSARYPAWQERSEADFGVMFMEALCALADELSYLQDRVAAEAALLTATERRSLISMARLVDYEPQPALSASCVVQCNVLSTTVPAGALILAGLPDGSVIPYEIGTSLADTTDYPVSPRWNDGIAPYWFDDSEQCLTCGATGMFLLGAGFSFSPGQALLLQTDLPGQSIREVLTLVSAAETADGIYLTGGAPTPVTEITWTTPTARDHDLVHTRLAGNLLPATQGRRFTESFAMDAPPPGSHLPVAIARLGPNGTTSQPNTIYRYALPRAAAGQGRLAWLAATSGDDSVTDPDIAKPRPEVVLTRRLPEPEAFSFATSLLDATAAEAAYTIDPAAWRAVAADPLGAPTQYEYDGDEGDTLRFGDGVFGAQPQPGDVYDVTYRIGSGAGGNVAADTILQVSPASAAFLAGVRNPFAVNSGSDEETAQHITRFAPQPFRAVAYRAVRPVDYEAAAETLPWVLDAGTAFRWTGSWLTVFTTADPKGNTPVSEAQQITLIDLLNRRRLAGYESYAPPPVLVAVDLRISVCVSSGWLAGDVEAGVLARLAERVNGFFYADSFTFATPLYRSRLEAAIQSVPGVKGVLAIEYRRRGATNIFQPLPGILPLGTGEILRIENDPSFPERGTIRVFPEGGR